MTKPSAHRPRRRRVRLLDPCNDLVFKLLLTGPRSKEVLRFVLEAVLRPLVPIRDFRVLDPAMRPGHLDEKEVFFDIRVELEDGSEVDVEMQCQPHPRFRDRLAYYGARGLVEQLQPGDGYGKLRPSIVIAFLGYREFDDERFHKRFRLADDEANTAFSSVLQIHTVELSKTGTLDEPSAARHHSLVAFARFLSAETESEFEHVAEEFPAMKQAVDILAELSQDPDVRRRARDREARLRLDAVLQRDAIREAHEQGREQGRDEGREQGRDEGRAALLRQLLGTRFGPFSAAVEARLASASRADLEVWAERILSAKQLDDVFR